MRRPGHSTAFALSTRLSSGPRNGRSRRTCGSGQKRTVRAGVALADLPITSSLRVHAGRRLKADVVFLAAAAHPALEVLRERVHHRHAHPVQPAGELVGTFGELAARVQAREDQLDAADLLLRVDVDRHAAAVIGHLERIVLVQRDVDAACSSRRSPHRRCCRSPRARDDWAGWCRCTCPGRRRPAPGRSALRCRMRYRLTAITGCGGQASRIASSSSPRAGLRGLRQLQSDLASAPSGRDRQAARGAAAARQRDRRVTVVRVIDAGGERRAALARARDHRQRRTRSAGNAPLRSSRRSRAPGPRRRSRTRGPMARHLHPAAPSIPSSSRQRRWRARTGPDTRAAASPSSCCPSGISGL